MWEYNTAGLWCTGVRCSCCWGRQDSDKLEVVAIIDCRAVVTWPFSSVWANMEESDDRAQFMRVQTTAILWAQGWWNEKSRYLSVCVGFL